MSINLQKGQKIDLSKGGSGISKLMVGLGWDEAPRSKGFFGFGGGASIDCDASCILLNSNGRLYGSSTNDCCVYYNNLKHSSGAIVHHGDNLTGAGDGDDECIVVEPSKLPQGVEKLVFVVNIYDAHNKKQHFGMIENAFIRIVDMSNNQEICRYNLSENYSGMTGLIAGEIYLKNGAWKFNAVGQGVQNAPYVNDLMNLYR